MNSRLVLFDIDGTLIYHVGPQRWEEQYIRAFTSVYHIPADFDIAQYDGTIDRHLAWDIAKKFDISRQQFLDRFPLYINDMHDQLTEWAKAHRLFKPIDDAVALVSRLSGKNDVFLGIITGNAKRIAQWKLEHTGLSGYFHFGLYGDEAESRIELARLVFAKAQEELHQTFTSNQITVIGDTVHDIRCGKDIGAYTIGVTTGMHGPKKLLKAEHPSLLVDSLMDKRVLALFSL
ncbi:hypothetical protein A2Z00_02645 [Candidatus Gottesmanbacteria bacterium RBG_13_45_10]|uniref:Haloacid dehalogenase n=1 Tax=Candidatus Gottesmanbacteria bacterium RBG_13_45_10 TaxID=1798370 RepID=A0A1F5ZG85_9BACT|nr:MAG: hypothetical protein A2Z00_02645 [Candidatus Gottesmanbacteria bacterium RBG_13_45_10]